MWHTLSIWRTKFIWTIKFTSCPAENTLILRYVDEMVISIDRNKYHLFKESYEVHKRTFFFLAKCTVLSVDVESAFATTVVFSIDHSPAWSQLFRNSSVSQEFPSVCVTRKFVTVHRCHYMSLTWVPEYRVSVISILILSWHEWTHLRLMSI